MHFVPLGHERTLIDVTRKSWSFARAWVRHGASLVLTPSRCVLFCCLNALELLVVSDFDLFIGPKFCIHNTQCLNPPHLYPKRNIYFLNPPHIRPLAPTTTHVSRRVSSEEEGSVSSDSEQRKLSYTKGVCVWSYICVSWLPNTPADARVRNKCSCTTHPGYPVICCIWLSSVGILAARLGIANLSKAALLFVVCPVLVY